MKKIRIIRALVISLMVMMLTPAPASAAQVTGTLTNAGPGKLPGNGSKRAESIISAPPASASPGDG